MKLRKVALSLACLLTVGAVVGCGGGVNYDEPEDTTKMYLRVDTYQGGFGSKFLEVAADEFQKAYPNYTNKYTENKSGVVIEVSETRNNSRSLFKQNVKNAYTDMHVVQGFRYMDYLGGEIFDLTDIMTDTLSDGKTIESKLNTQQQDILKYNGKYYSIPTFTGFGGLSYNVSLFEDNNLFFADSTVSPNVTSSYTDRTYTGRPLIANASDKKSPGPDGIYNTEDTPSYDDGLPSSYEEFFYLFDAMLAKNITPLITNKSHYSNYIFSELLCAASTAKSFNAMFTFDSQGEKVEVVTGWNGNMPETQKIEITAENGYLSTAEYSKYIALKFINHLTTYEAPDGKQYIHADSRTGSISNIDAQYMFLESYFDHNISSIATLCEGVYWYNEAEGSREAVVNDHGSQAENMNLGFMALPAIETGTVVNGEGTTQLVADNQSYYLIINANTAKDKAKLALAKDFIKFMYSDEMLQKMTIASNIPFALKYDLTKEQYNSMGHFAQSVWGVSKAAIDKGYYITCLSQSSIFRNNLNKFCFETDGDFFKSKINGADSVDALSEFFKASRPSVKDFFEGMTINESDWKSQYNK